MTQSIRTPLGKVRGLGAAKEGPKHFIAQRVSALILIFLVPWFLVELLIEVRAGFREAMGFVQSPIHAILIVILLAAACFHMRIGMQVVIEDYIGRTSTRIFLLILNTFVCIAAFAAGAFATLTIAT